MYAQLKVDYDTMSDKILKLCQFNFQELFVALVHLKVMRTFIDGVLRFGIPPKFFLGVIKPVGKGNDTKILQRLEDAFAEEHMKGMYGAKTDANDEDLERTILQVAYNKKELTYLECKYQFILEVLEDKKYLNDNILGKFYDRDFK